MFKKIFNPDLRRFWFQLSEWILLLLPLFFPLYQIKLQIWLLPTNLLEIIFGFSILSFLIGWLVKGLREGFDFNWKKMLVENSSYFLWGMILLFIMSYSVNVPDKIILYDNSSIFEGRKVALGILKSWIILPLIYLMMLSHFVKRKSQLKISVWAYLISILPLAFWAVFQQFTGQFITPDARASGPFENANYLAMYMAPGVVAAWIYSIRSVIFKTKFTEFFASVLLALFLTFVVLLTQSYAAIGAILISIVIFLIASWKDYLNYEKKKELGLLKKIFVFLGIVGVCILVAGYALFYNTEKWQLFGEFTGRSSSSVRIQVYDIGLKLISENALFGIGLGQFQARYNLKAVDYLGKEPFEWNMLHVHNTFLAFWLNLGLAGFILFLYLIYLVLINWIKASDFEERSFRLIGVCMFLIFLTHGMVDTYFFKNDLSFLFWLVFAIAVIPKKDIYLKHIKI